MKFIFDIKLKEEGNFQVEYSFKEYDKDDKGNIDVKAYRKGLVAVIKSITGIGILDKEFENKLEALSTKEWDRLKVTD